MLARVLSAAVNGIEAFPVELKVNCGCGDTLIVIVGLPDAAVKRGLAEQCVSIQASFRNSSGVRPASRAMLPMV
jgi:predicted ATPase with chaperone activity